MSRSAYFVPGHSPLTVVLYGHIIASMAIPKIKSTYSLDIATVADLETLATRWNVSKSEVLRRVISAAARIPAEGSTEKLDALSQLQTSLGLNKTSARKWATESGRERRASSK